MKFIITVPDNEGVTLCGECPFEKNENVCNYCYENNFCTKYNFANLNIEEYNESSN